ncbi:MAG: mechanosensitive ion channel family protein, partial [Burkholderiales bacterium]
MKDLGAAITNSASAILERLVTYLPSVLGAVLLLFAGWFLGRLLRALTVRGAVLAETLLARFLAPRAAEKLRFGRSAAVLGTVVFWVVLLFFVTAATQVLGLQTFTDWLAR